VSRKKRVKMKQKRTKMIPIPTCWYNYPVSSPIVSLLHYLSFGNPASSLVDDHLHKSIRQ